MPIRPQLYILSILLLTLATGLYSTEATATDSVPQTAKLEQEIQLTKIINDKDSRFLSNISIIVGVISIFITFIIPFSVSYIRRVDNEIESILTTHLLDQQRSLTRRKYETYLVKTLKSSNLSKVFQDGDRLEEELLKLSSKEYDQILTACCYIRENIVDDSAEWLPHLKAYLRLLSNKEYFNVKDITYQVRDILLCKLINTPEPLVILSSKSSNIVSGRIQDAFISAGVFFVLVIFIACLNLFIN